MNVAIVWIVVLFVVAALIGGRLLYLCAKRRARMSANASMPLKQQKQELLSAEAKAEVLLMEEKRIFDKPLSKLPIAVDLPRLAHKTSVYNDKGKKIVAGIELPPLNSFITREGSPVNKSAQSPGGQSSRAVYEVMLAIAIAISEEKEAGLIKSCFSNYIPDNANVDVGQRLMSMLENELGESSKVVSVLKLMNQASLAPAAIRLKSTLNRSFQYKDRRGEWTIDVRALSKDMVEVVHTKRETSWDSSGIESANSFDFIWQLRLRLCNLKSQPELQAADFFISEMYFSPNMPPHKRATILHVVENLYKPSLLHK